MEKRAREMVEKHQAREAIKNLTNDKKAAQQMLTRIQPALTSVEMMLAREDLHMISSKLAILATACGDSPGHHPRQSNLMVDGFRGADVDWPVRIPGLEHDSAPPRVAHR